MNSFFNWWITDSNGNEYMSLLHCALNDYLVIVLILTGCFGVVVQYSDIAYRHLVNSKKYPETKLSKYFVGITKVFILCLIAGYGYRILSVFVNPYKLLILILFVLNVVTYNFRKSFKGLDVFHRINELEQKFGVTKKEIEHIKDSIVVDLFNGKEEIQFIPFRVLDKIIYDFPFDSDGRNVIINTRINKEMPGFTATSTVKANSYITPHQHDTDKILKCTKGAFFDNHTNKWYKENEYLLIPKTNKKNPLKNWHDIKTGAEETELLTFIMPK